MTVHTLHIKLVLTLGSLFRAYDRAAVKFRGVNADINFTLSDYEEDLKQVCYCSQSFNFSFDLCVTED